MNHTIQEKMVKALHKKQTKKTENKFVSYLLN